MYQPLRNEIVMRVGPVDSSTPLTPGILMSTLDTIMNNISLALNRRTGRPDIFEDRLSADLKNLLLAFAIVLDLILQSFSVDLVAFQPDVDIFRDFRRFHLQLNHTN